MTNPWEELYRTRKCMALVAALQAAKFTAELAERMEYADWVLVAAQCHVKPPSADTRAMVLDALRRSEPRIPQPVVALVDALPEPWEE